ncbi:MAG: isochorismatase family protein [Anaerolineales bacterium]
MKPALLVIDVQKEFYRSDPATARSLHAAVEYINAALALFRAKNLPVFCIQHVDTGDNLAPGQAGFDLPEELQILPSDMRIQKTYSNAFNKTPLHSLLQELGVGTVILSGYCAEFCVLSTYRGAQDLDLTPLLLRGALASGHAENIRFVERISDIISYRALQKFL